MKPLLISAIIPLVCLLSSCSSPKNSQSTQEIRFATAAEYPPFEYQVRGVIQGFDIDLANLIAKKLGKQAVFDNMKFSTILPVLTSHQVDAAISTMTVTAARKKNFDFTTPYYFEGMAVIFKKTKPIQNAGELSGKKIAVQLGTTMEIWLKKQMPSAILITMDNNNQAVAALNADHVDAVLIDGAQGKIFSKKNTGLSSNIIAKAEDGYAIALNKNSTLLPAFNAALETLEQDGSIERLQHKWLGK